jgi:protein involved in polysaccharide export with SLBB domain
MIRSYILLALVWSAFALHAEIKVGDTLQIYLKGVPASEKPKVDGRYVVGESGTIRVPLADVSLKAAGLTGEQLARKMEAVFRTAEIYTRPTVEVVTNDAPEPAAARVSVGGQAKRAGVVAFRPGMTVVQAIQAAGDMTPFGTKKRITVERDGKVIKLDLRQPAARNFKLRVDDTIVVDQRGPFDGE